MPDETKAVFNDPYLVNAKDERMHDLFFGDGIGVEVEAVSLAEDALRGQVVHQTLGPLCPRGHRGGHERLLGLRVDLLVVRAGRAQARIRGPVQVAVDLVSVSTKVGGPVGWVGEGLVGGGGVGVLVVVGLVVEGRVLLVVAGGAKVLVAAHGGAHGGVGRFAGVAARGLVGVPRQRVRRGHHLGDAVCCAFVFGNALEDLRLSMHV